MDDMKHVMKLPSEGQISLWTDNDMKHMDQREPHLMQILSKVLDHIMGLKKNTDGDNGLSQLYQHPNNKYTTQYTIA